MNSIGIVLRYRRLVGVILTAAFVLLSHVYCACGAAASAGAKDAAAEVAALPPCHRHAAGHDGAGKRGSDPADRGGHSECQHCKPSTVASAAKVADVKPALTPAALLAPLVVSCLPHSTLRPALIAGDSPTPRPCCSLLGLHCALNT